MSCHLHMHITVRLSSYLDSWPVEAKGGSLGAHWHLWAWTCHAQQRHHQNFLALEIEGKSDGNLLREKKLRPKLERQSQDSQACVQLQQLSLSRAPLVSTTLLLQEFYSEVKMGILQGLVELIFAGSVPGLAEVEQHPHLVWISGLSPHPLTLLLTQHVSIQLVQDSVH